MKHLVFPLPASHRGLANGVGENNCFLNVTVQALWHLGPFRTELKRLIDSNTSSVRRMMRSTRELEDDGDGDGELVATPRLLEEDSDSFSTGLGISGATAACSPDEQGFVHVELEPVDAVTYVPAFGSRLGMIDALCNLFTQYEMSHLSVLPPDELRQTLQAISGRFDLGEIADANEALDAILGHIHDENGTRCPDHTKCLSHAVFGGLMMEQTFCPKCGSTSEPTLRQAFMHNLSAVELIEAAKKNPTETFAYLIRRCSGVGQKECPSVNDDPPPRYACKSKANVRVFCLEAPLALALAVGWTSTSESASVLRNFYRLVSRSIRLNQLFMPGGAAADNSDDGPEYLFRGMVCYYGLHYVSIFQEHGTVKARFLLFDDKTVRPIGAWDEVVELAIKSRYQPVCLLYERSSRSRSRGGSVDMHSTVSSNMNTSTSSSDGMGTDGSLSPAVTHALGLAGAGYGSDSERDKERDGQRGMPKVLAVAQAKIGREYKDTKAAAGPKQDRQEHAAPDSKGLQVETGSQRKGSDKRSNNRDRDTDKDLQWSNRSESKLEHAPEIPAPPPQDIFLNYSGAAKDYEVVLKKAQIKTDGGAVLEVLGFQPLVMPGGKVLVGELYNHPQTGAPLPASAAGISLLDEILIVNGRPCIPPVGDANISSLFKASELRLRLRSSYKRALIFFCPHCTEENVIQEADIECVRGQFQNEGRARLVCSICDTANPVPSWKELLDAQSTFEVN